jgi:hypothetical protein
MGTQAPKIKKGDKLWCFHRKMGDKPMLGTVICLTTEPGKLIGLQFDEPVPEGLAHLDCDGRGKKGHCAWAHPDHVLTEEEYKGKLEAEAAAKQAAAEIKELDELVLR